MTLALLEPAISDGGAKRVGGEAVFVGFGKVAVGGGADANDGGAEEPQAMVNLRLEWRRRSNMMHSGASNIEAGNE
jgi:hypothetical protein